MTVEHSFLPNDVDFRLIEYNKNSSTYTTEHSYKAIAQYRKASVSQCSKCT